MTTTTTTLPRVSTEATTEVTTEVTTEATSARPRRRRRPKHVLKYGSALLVVLLARVAFDLYAPRRTSMREFDADEVARLETAKWRS